MYLYLGAFVDSFRRGSARGARQPGLELLQFGDQQARETEIDEVNK